MKRAFVPVCLSVLSLMALAGIIAGSSASAVPSEKGGNLSSQATAPGLGLGATDVILKSNSATGAASTVTFQSLNGFSGPVIWECGPSTVPAPQYVPTCTIFPTFPLTLSANQSATRTVRVVPYGYAAPEVTNSGFASLPVVGVAMLIGLGTVRIRMKSRNWRTLAGVAGALILAMGITACGGASAHTGTFRMMVHAQALDNPVISTQATFTVTVQ